MGDLGSRKLKNPRQAFANFVEEKRLEEKKRHLEFLDRKENLEIQKKYLAGGYTEEDTLKLAEVAKEEVKRLAAKYGKVGSLETGKKSNEQLENSKNNRLLKNFDS